MNLSPVVSRAAYKRGFDCISSAGNFVGAPALSFPPTILVPQQIRFHPMSPTHALRLRPRLRLLLLSVGLLCTTLATFGGTVRIHDASGLGLTSHPLQIGRAFLPGEIAADPGVSIAGSTIPSQAEVTMRYPDGSAKFAVISTILPTIAAGGTVQLAFSSTTSSATTTTISDLLALFPEFDAKINLTQTGVTKTVSARTMLLGGHAMWLARGPLRYELLVADHVGRSYDLGFDAYRPLRPVFHVAFWPSLGKVRVRFVMENPNLDALEQVAYDVTLTTGKTTPSTVYSKAGVTHWFGSRWSKVFWIGGTPEQKVNVDSDLAHLAATKFIPNYDPTNIPAASYMDYQWTYWQTRPQDLYDEGYWTRYMPTTGGRGEIGPMPALTEIWLSTGDWRMREIALKSADLAGAWPLHFREHNAAAFFDRAHTVSAAGKPLSLVVHPELWFPTNNGVYENMIPGAQRDVNWVADGAHQPDPFSVPYLLTGDSYYLESMQLWAATQTFAYGPGIYGRGKSGYGAIQDQVRGNGWVLRNRALTSALSPDGSPEKLYFAQLMDDAIAFWEGERGLADPNYDNHPNRIWAAANYPMDWSPLRFWARKDIYFRRESFWMDWYFMTGLGIARDLGFGVDPLFKEYSKLLTAQFNTPGYDPRYSGIYQTIYITASPEDAWLTSWLQVAAVNDAEQPTASVGAIQSYELAGDPGLCIPAATAASMTTSYPGGSTTWTWLKAKVYDRMDMTGEYRRWKILPRATIVPPSDAIITITVD